MNPKLIIGAAAIVLLAALGGGGWYFYSQRGDKQKGSPEAPAAEVGEPTPSADQEEPRQESLTGSEETAQIVDVDDLLGHTLEEAVLVLGDGYETSPVALVGTEAFLWSDDKTGFQVQLMRPRGGTKFGYVTVGIRIVDREITREQALKMAGLDGTSFQFDVAGSSYWPEQYGRVSYDLRTDGVIDENTTQETGELVYQEKYYDHYIGVYTRDWQRKVALRDLGQLLEVRRSANGDQELPNSDNRLVLWKDAESFDSTPLSSLSSDPESWPSDIYLPSEGTFYGYRSDGQTRYELTAVLEDHDDPECVIENGFCIYRIRNGEVVSRK